MNLNGDLGWLDRVRWYAQPAPQQDLLRAEYVLREKILKTARELDEIAAEIQAMADELREAIR